MSPAPSSLSLRLMRWAVHQAAHRLHEPERAEAEAEWLGHLEELPEGHLRLWHLVGVWRCAHVSALHLAWDGMTRAKVQEFLVYAFWMVSCMALITDYRAGTSFRDAFPHLLGAVFCCGPAMRFVLKPLEERKSD